MENVHKDINPKDLSNKDLLFSHAILHTWWRRLKEGKKVKGWSEEDVFNLHELIAEEMKKRGYHHYVRDSLDKATIKSQDLEEKHLSLREVLDSFPKEVIVEPEHVYLVGGVANRGWTSKSHDIDMVVCQNFEDSRISKAIKNSIENPDVRDLVEFIWEKEGPIIGNEIPVYQLVLKRIDPLQLQARLRLFNPFIPPKAATGYRKFEFFSPEELWKYWGKGYAKEGIAVESKYDGMRMIIHKKGDKVAIYTEDTRRDRAKFIPSVTEEVKKLKHDCILDSEIVWWKKGKPIPREDMPAMVVGKTPLEGEDIRANIFDCVYFEGKDLHNLTWKERQTYLSKVLPKSTDHLIRVQPIVVKTRSQLLKAYDKLSNYPGSEGIMAKWVNSKYEVSWDETPERMVGWAKSKKVFEIDVEVTKIIKKKITKGPRKGKWTGAYIYECAILDKDKEILIPIGKTYATSIKADVGDIITVRTVRIEVSKVNNKYHVTWMFPIVKNKQLVKTKPDDINFAMKIARETKGVKLSGYIILEKCPHSGDKNECPLLERYFVPEELSLVYEALKYPIQCEHAYKYRCPYVKPYYYEFRELQKLSENLQAQYMEYPEKKNPKFVMQHHWRGKSVHTDLRFEMNDHLVGWTLLDSPKSPKAVDNEADAEKMEKELNWDLNNEPGMKGKKVLATMKARQPKVWLGIKGKVEPGDIGATKHEVGFFHVLDSGTVEFGAQKPYFHEYFLHGKKFNGRFVVRGVRLPKLDPQTKRPIPGKFEIKWECWKPESQEPYAVSKRAREKKWIPPENVIPLPQDWIKSHQKEFKEWQKWVSEMRKKPAKESLEKTGRYKFVLQKGEWGTAKGIRGQKFERYFIRVKTNRNVLSWILEESPIYADVLPATYEGRIRSKWFGFEGKIPPHSRYNPTKTLDVQMSIVDSGTVDIKELEPEAGKGKQFKFIFRGNKLRGVWKGGQEDIKQKRLWSFRRVLKTQLLKSEFVLQRHWCGEKEHWDLRFDLGLPYLEHFQIWKNPLINQSKPHLGDRSPCYDKDWMTKEGIIKPGEKGYMCRTRDTHVDIIDKGNAEIIERKPNFFSFRALGRKLKGYYVCVKRNDKWFFMKTKFPPAKMEMEGHPAGKPFRPPRFEGHKNTFELETFDLRYFTKIKSKPLKGVKGIVVNYGVFPVKGQIPDVYIQGLEFDKKFWTEEKARKFYNSIRQKIEKFKVKEPRGDKPLKTLYQSSLVQEMLSQLESQLKVATREEKHLQKIMLEKSIIETLEQKFSLPYRIKFKAIAVGKFNGVFYSEKELKSAVASMKGVDLTIDHGKSVRDVVGKVEDAWWDENLKGIVATAIITDKEVAEKVHKKLVSGVSVEVLVDYHRSDMGLSAHNCEFIAVSIVRVPACHDCRIFD